MKNLVLVAALAMAGCTHSPVRDLPVTVKVPVPQPCAGTRPAAVPTLKDTYPDPAWSQMDVKQRAAAVSAQGLKLRTYGEQLNAATAACPPAAKD